MHRLIIAHSSGFHNGVRDAVGELPEAIRPEASRLWSRIRGARSLCHTRAHPLPTGMPAARVQVLFGVWTAFFKAWSIELGVQAGSDLEELADERMRMTAELTARRSEALEMRQGMQRLMRDQVERMIQVHGAPSLGTSAAWDLCRSDLAMPLGALARAPRSSIRSQEREDAKERDELRNKVLRDRTSMQTAALELQVTSARLTALWLEAEAPPIPRLAFCPC